jgi:hypothetical protein
MKREPGHEGEDPLEKLLLARARAREARADSKGYVVGKASITNLLPMGRARDLQVGLGSELRRRRLAANLSQDQASGPLTRAYLSGVESGRTMPSLAALVVLADQLGTSADEILRGVNMALNSEYSRGRENH